MFLKKSEWGLGNGKCPETLRGQKKKKKTGTECRSKNETVKDKEKRQMEEPGRKSQKQRKWRGEE